MRERKRRVNAFLLQQFSIYTPVGVIYRADALSVSWPTVSECSRIHLASCQHNSSYFITLRYILTVTSGLCKV